MENRKKLIAMFLVFTLTFSHFAVLTESLATTGFVSLFGASSDTGNENVEFEAYLANEEETSNALVSDVNNQNLAIGLKLDVKESGYLKNGKVEIKPQENEELNFKIKEENGVAEQEYVQNLEGNILELNKIDYSSDAIEISIPIKYYNEEYISETKLNSTAKVILSGIYIDDEGEENEISKEVELTLAWEDNRTAKVEEEISKYIQFGDNGIILQTVVKVDTSAENQNSLPVKETNLRVDVPQIKGQKPSEVSVVANSTRGTNGKGVGEVEFTDENWAYDQENGTVQIKVENQKQLVEVSEFDEYLKVEGEETKQEERYFSQAGTDEFVLTYTFQNISIEEEMQVSSNIEAKAVLFSGITSENQETTTTAERTDEILLTGQTGNIISYNVENETEEVSKSSAYLNKEQEYNSKTSINVSYTDIVEEMIVEDIENNYIDKSGNKTQTEDIYYKQISVSQENFNQILGQDGNIQILDDSGNVVATVNKETQTDKNGNFVIDFPNKISKISIKTSAPVNTGNLIIASKKAVSNISISKDDYANLEAIETTTVQKAKLTYVSEITELGNISTKTKLSDTTTNFNLKIDRDSLSTVTTNTNVEMRLELNNDKKTSDKYGNSVFEIEMPEQITNMNITNASMIYGEGLEIVNVESYVRDGKIIIKITVAGNQTDFNSGVLTNGTNIVLNADIDVDRFTPAIYQAIKAYCYNSEATNYANSLEYQLENTNAVAYQEAEIKYSAPSGVVAINTLSNYNNKGSILTSMKQGNKIDYIDTYAEAKRAKMEIAIMNNNENAITNVAILGRIPFEGIKDLTTDENLGTTLDTKMVSPITSSENNNGEFTIYYSENREATGDLNREANGWTTNPESLENIQSYLIIPNNENQTIEAKQVLKFTYEYEIPANLNHNETIYGTFVATYTNNIDGNQIEEQVKPDQIGLTTGAGPELEIDLKADVTEVKENDEIKLTTTIKNVGQDTAQDVLVAIPLPANTSFVSAEADKDIANIEFADGKVIVRIENLPKNTSLEITTVAKVEKIYSEDTVNVFATVEAKDLNAQLSSNKIEIKLEPSEWNIYQFIDSEVPADFYYKKGDELNITIRAENLTTENKKDVTVVTKLPQGLTFQKAYMVGREDQGNYDSSKGEVTWKIGDLEANKGQTLKLVVNVGDLSEGTTASTVSVATEISAENTKNYLAKDIKINIGKSSIQFTQNSSTSTYVAEGEIINYEFTIKNEGMKEARNVVLTDNIPEGIVVTKMTYRAGEVESTRSVSETEKTELTLSVPAGDEVTVNIQAVASNLNGSKEKTVTNVATLANAGREEITSNSVTHIIQATESDEDPEGSAVTDNNSTTNNNGSQLGTNTNTDITKSYKISGVAWLDANENGMRDDGEQRMSGVTAMLVESSTGVIKGTMTTNQNGEYSFAGIGNGSYLVLFKYDTILYTTTTYRKEGIESNINSDVVTTKIEQNGKRENGAVTDVISVNGANVTNIDVGLVEAAKFSLGIDKAITKVTVQNAQGTVTEEFDKTKLSQYGITAKYLAGTTVYVEYTMTVTNNGDLAGFASEIVDYIPQGMTFNSNLNPDWYTGAGGNLYTKALADKELASGQSQEIKLVLTKQMTTENTGLVSNTAEIADDFNIYGVSDRNSVPNNKAQGEDDISTADIILTVKTGETLIYVSAMIISILIGGAVAFIVYEKVLKNKRKGGV